MSRPRLFAELPAGLASVSLRLHGGKHCRPPISRMGNKAGYGEAILGALGLRSGSGAGAYLWAEADPDVAALLRCYPDASMLRRVAEIIRGWADEEPRALWERLRAERKARGAMTTPEGTAGWVVDVAWSIGNDAGRGGFKSSNAGGEWFAPQTCDKFADRCHRLAEYATIVSGNRLVNMAGPALMNTGNGGTRHGGEFATPVGDVAAATARLAVGVWPPVLVLPTIPEAADVAAWMGTPGDLEGCVVYADPPYAGTTGYAATLSRAEVVRYALAFSAMGATVAISEATPIAELEGWHATEITGGRKGQKRTFSKQQGEWLTMNRAPVDTIWKQMGLFG